MSLHFGTKQTSLRLFRLSGSGNITTLRTAIYDQCAVLHDDAFVNRTRLDSVALEPLADKANDYPMMTFR